jgi:hypothetical protein
MATKNQPKKVAAKKAPVKKAVTKKTTDVVSQPKKVVEKVSTLEQRFKEKSNAFECLVGEYNKLFRKHVELEKSYSMVKENYDREKNRLDKVIDASLNNSKVLEAITNTDEVLQYSTGECCQVSDKK